MFIVWRRRPILTDRPAELFGAYDDIPASHPNGGGLRTSRRKRGPAQDDAPWKPLVCRHAGPGRIAWTPFLMHTQRINGKPRQQVLHRFPTIRSCCIGAPFMRAAWWYEVERQIASAEQRQPGLASRLIDRERQATMRKLRQVVPRPTLRGVRDFTEYRLQKEAEQRQVEEAVFESRRQAEETGRREEQRRQAEEERRRQAEEEARRQEEEARRQEEEDDRWEYEWWREQQSRTWGRGSTDPWWVVLELPSPMATAEQVRAQYRKLVMQHHPDRGGDPETCKKLNAAREEAEKHFGDRW